MAAKRSELRPRRRPAGPDGCSRCSCSASSTSCSSARCSRPARAPGMIVIVAVGAASAPARSPRTRSRSATLGAHEVTPQQEPELHAIIERLCIQADLPKPRVARDRGAMPNACALGRSQKAATVCATRGILELLSPAELEGVIGARAHARDQPRRDGDDDRELLRDARRADHPLRVLLRRRLRRRQPRRGARRSSS